MQSATMLPSLFKNDKGDHFTWKIKDHSVSPTSLQWSSNLAWLARPFLPSPTPAFHVSLISCPPHFTVQDAPASLEHFVSPTCIMWFRVPVATTVQCWHSALLYLPSSRPAPNNKFLPLLRDSLQMSPVLKSSKLTGGELAISLCTPIASTLLIQQLSV